MAARIPTTVLAAAVTLSSHDTLDSSRYPGTRALGYRDGIRVVRGDAVPGGHAAAEKPEGRLP
ncbi:hypothetical protein ACFWVF_18670 [Streptomyces sp. NPDC058659]|uniref:hypothetical protein n=1 Tax=unclassified Streptomyces TaxID=2593676 RepID=UPI00364ADC81